MAAKRRTRVAGAAERRLAATVRRSAREIWYAGLGVFAATREEGGKVFAALVKEGRRAEASARRLADSALSRARRSLGKVVPKAKKRPAARRVRKRAAGK